MSQKPIFASPADVEAAFYEALESADLAAMMALWAEDEDIVCVHPGGPRLVGYAVVREAWRRIFEHGRRLRVERSALSVVTTPFAVTHFLIEHVRLREGKVGGVEVTQAPVAATNVYVRGAMGWRMVAHHASPVPPDSVTEAPKVLH
jgi:ketosteroid isomerase-like protein